MIPVFYTPKPAWGPQVEHIIEMVGRVSAFDEMSGRAAELRRDAQIASVHASTAIEGNTLTLPQVEEVAAGREVPAPPREIQEVVNGLAANAELGTLDPWNVDDFLRAHALLTDGLVKESGQFRTVDVQIVNRYGEVLHSGSSIEKVPRLIQELLEWGSKSEDHPLIVSSAVHFLIEYIHPFRDGNGRIGRLWQALILSCWREIFASIPVDTAIRQNQLGYYRALQASHEDEIDAAPFIQYMLDTIEVALGSFENELLPWTRNVGMNVGMNVGIKDELLQMIIQSPAVTAEQMAQRLRKSARTVERYLAELKQEGRIAREGSRKAGRWVVIPQ